MLSIATIGSAAAQCLELAARQPQRVQITAQFERCCYLSLSVQTRTASVATHCLCIGQPQIMPGPLNLLFADQQQWQYFARLIAADTAATQRAAGRACVIGGRCLQLTTRSSNLQIDYHAAAVSADRVPRVASHCCLATLSLRLRRLCRASPADSLAALLLPTGLVAGKIAQPPVSHDAVQAALVDYLTPACRSLSAALRQELQYSAQNSAAPALPPVLPGAEAPRLLGAGAGLTPAGDDFLAGVMLGLHYFNHAALAQSLMQSLSAELPDRTHAVSAALLQQAAQGRAGQAMLRVLQLLDTPGAFDCAKARVWLDRQGHTSGWDCIAGVALVAQLLSACSEQGEGGMPRRHNAARSAQYNYGVLNPC